MEGNNVDWSKPPARERTIFVGGIPLASTVNGLKDYLTIFDNVEKIHLPRDPDSGQIRGYAKVVMASLEGVDRIISQPYHKIGGLKIGITKWTDQTTYLQKKDEEGERKVHVKIPDHTTEADLFGYFSWFGEIEHISVRTYPGTNIRRGFCYITFKNVMSARKVVQKGFHKTHKGTFICELSIRPTTQNKQNWTSDKRDKDIFQNAKENSGDSFENLNYPKPKLSDQGNSTKIQQIKMKEHKNVTPSNQSYSKPHTSQIVEYVPKGLRKEEFEGSGFQQNQKRPQLSTAHHKPTSVKYDGSSNALAAMNHNNNWNVSFRIRLE